MESRTMQYINELLPYNYYELVVVVLLIGLQIYSLEKIPLSQIMDALNTKRIILGLSEESILCFIRAIRKNAYTHLRVVIEKKKAYIQLKEIDFLILKKSLEFDDMYRVLTVFNAVPYK